MKNKWFIALKKNDGNLFNMENLHEIPSPKGRYYADPFLFKKDDVNYVFFEDTDYEKGVISYCTIDKDFNASEPKVILERPYHLSFPCIFQDGDDIYMIPETNSEETIELYLATDFPNEWVFAAGIFKGAPIADTVVYKHKETWFLFCTAMAGRPTNKEGVPQEHTTLDDGLIILYTDDIKKGWKMHPKCEGFPLFIPGSRSAGNIFEYEGKLIRPIQKRDPLTGRYGYGTGFKEIEINETEYSEKILDHEILPNWHDNLIGTHTFNFNEDITVIDGKLKIDKITEETIEYTESNNLFPSEDKHFVNYWFPRNPNYKSKLSVEKREENLKILTTTLKDFNIDSCLIFGTLLGALRDKSLIPHDHDDDIFVYEKDRDLFTKDLITTLEKQNFRIMRIADNSQTLSFVREGYYIDVYFVHLNEKNKWQWREVEMSEHYFNSLDTLTLHNGDVYNTPHNAEGFLESTYGDWKTPNPDHGWVNGKYAPID